MEKWDLAKNIKEREAIAILRIKSERDAGGRITWIGIHNRTVDLDRLLRHARGRGPGSTQGEVESLPSYISCKTPPPERLLDLPFDDDCLAFGSLESTKAASGPSGSSISLSLTNTPLASEAEVDEMDSEWSGASTPLFDDDVAQIDQNNMLALHPIGANIHRSLSPPKIVYIPEQLFYNIKTYYATSFEKGMWINRKSGDGTLCKVSNLPDPDCRNEFLGYCYMAADLRRRGFLVEFRRVVYRAFGLIENILRSSHPRTLDRLFESFLCLIHSGLMEVAIQLRDYIRELATYITSSGQPWGRVFRLIGTLDESSLEQAIARSWQCNNDALDDGLSQFSDLGLLARLNHIRNVHGTSDSQEEERLLRQLLQECECSSPKSDMQIPTIMVSLAHCMMAQGRYLEAESLSLEIMARSRKESRITLNSRVDAIVLAARAQYHQHKTELAESSIREAICLLVDEWGKTGPLAIQYMNTLEGWLREWGREKDADDLKVTVDLVIGLCLSCNNPIGSFDTVLPLDSREGVRETTQQFYEDSTVLRLWADGICINQDDGVEKSHQVQQMALIYERATKVLAWLGPAADGSDQLLKCIEKKGTIIIVSAIAKGADMSEEFKKDLRVLGLQQLFRKALKSPQMIKDLLSEISWLDLELSFPSHSYKKILERSLWKRIWILQEISLGSNVHLVCGNTSILYDYFIAVHSLVLSCMTILSDLRERWRDFYLELVPSLSVSTVATRHRLLDEEMSLLDMLDLTAGLAATDKRDYIFALLGLVNDVEALDIRPDYTVASGQVYKEVARKFLWYYGMRTLSWAPSSQRKPHFTRALIPLRLLSGEPLDDLEAENGLPSWVPDWSQRRPFHMIQPRQIELDISFSASGGSTQPISEEDQGEDWNIIALAACCVGIVTVCGSVQHPRAVLDSMTGSPTVVRTAARKFLNDLEALAVEHMGPSGLDKQRDEAIWWVPIMHRDPKMAPSPKRAEYGEISKRLHQSYLALRELPQPPEYGEPLDSTTRPLLLPRHLPVSSAQGQTDVAEPSFLEGCYTRAKMLWPLNDGSEYLHMMHGAEMPFITDSRHLGIGPAAMQSGDQIHIFYGSEVPFILRPMDNGQYKFIGEAYVYGIMHGEFMRTNPPTHVINLE
ncbi:heterokaryon incompatibility protein-domain-containing protein [Leptodontidium sp. MPI-SDFR-AT-0119]|nr:heterokaryon incompatibility protein-domain-containing protein [Leptodontidium sp. MPI-SDFR-AT-0119]